MGQLGAGYRIAIRDYDERTAQVTLDAMLCDGDGNVGCTGVIEAFMLAPAPGPDPPDAAPARHTPAVRSRSESPGRRG